MPNVHLVIPVFNNWELTHSQLWSLYRKERENVSSILIVDDASTDEEVEYGINWWEAKWKEKVDPLPIRSIRNEVNLGFLKSANRGLMDVTSKSHDVDIVILLSNDVLINGKFISQICGIIQDSGSSVVGGVLYNYDTGWNKFGDRIFNYLEGWLLATTVENWKKLDYLDERYAPSDFEDIHLSTKALSLGMELVPLNNVGLQHLGGRSIGYNDERLAITKRNQEIFRKIWIGQSLETK